MFCRLAVCLLALLLVGCAGRTPPTAGIPHFVGPGDADGLAQLLAYDSRGLTKLPPDYVLRRLRTREEVPDIAAAFDAVVAADSPATRAALLRAIELDFIHSADTSSLDLLGLELGERFKSFDWQENDYPGGAEGPNEMYAGTLADALDSVTPERRANRAAVAVIRRVEATDALWDYMLAQWQPVPGEDSKKLNLHAVDAYVTMRNAAAEDGIDLTILSGHRDPKRAAANAARVGNSFAVASFSSHSLGLAIDVELPRADQGRFRLSTTPMADVVAMRRSPVHKWLHLHAHKFGWYPFQHEPWHWEYNPPGFRDVFFANRQSGTPPRVDVDD
jgi:hypothetical protein